MLIGHGKGPGNRGGWNCHAEPRAQFLKSPAHGALGEEAKMRVSLSKKHVGAGRKRRNHRQFLIDSDNAAGARCAHIASLQDMTEDFDLARGRWNSPSQHAKQGRFARAILTDERVNGPDGDLQRHRSYGDGIAERLADVLKTDRRNGGPLRNGECHQSDSGLN